MSFYVFKKATAIFGTLWAELQAHVTKIIMLRQQTNRETSVSSIVLFREVELGLLLEICF